MESWENQKNMESCPKFISCDIPVCPLDIDSNLRVELKEDPKCINWKLIGKLRTKKMGGHIMPSLKEKVSLIGSLRK
jgi:hypothetical protein